jgi:hypothetical protein
MEEPNQQESQEKNKQEEKKGFVLPIRMWMEFYLDIVIRGLISFGVSLVIILLLRTQIKLGTVISLVITFIISILISPIFSKVKLAYLIMERYDRFLNRLMEKHGK